MKKFIRRWLEIEGGHHHPSFPGNPDDKTTNLKNGSCDFTLLHYKNVVNDLWLTLIFQCDEGLIGHVTSGTKAEGIKMSEDVMAEYDIERVTRA